MEFGYVLLYTAGNIHQTIPTDNNDTSIKDCNTNLQKYSVRKMFSMLVSEILQ